MTDVYAIILMAIAVAIVMIVMGYPAPKIPGVHFHTWGKWQYKKTLEYMRSDSDYPVMKAEIWERKCETCGMPKQKKIKEKREVGWE